MKIAAAIIAYNCEKQLSELLDSVKKQVDYIVVAIDPKTTDGTRAVAEKYGAIVCDGLDVLETGFSEARDLSFAHVPKDADWTIWLDTDDILRCDIPLRELCGRMPPEASGIALPYAYFRDAFGNITTLFDRERVLRMAHGPRWKGYLHEVVEMERMGKFIRPYNTPEEAPVWVEHKNRHEDGKGGRNFTLLEKWLAAEPGSSRCMWYFGMQYFAGNDWEKAADWFERAVAANPAQELEPWQGLVYASKAYKNLGQNDKAIGAANRAMMMFPDLADPYHDMSYAYQAAGDWQKAIWWHEQGLAKNQPGGPIMVNPLDYTYNPFVTIHTSYAMLGRFEEALAKIEAALAIRPDPAVQKVRDAYAHRVYRRRAIDGGMTLANHLATTAELDKAKRVIESMPAGAAEDEPQVLQGAGVIRKATAHLALPERYEDYYFQMQEPDRAPNDRHRWIADHAVATGVKRVLWVGAGNFAGPFLLAERGIKVVVVDCDPRRIRLGNAEAAKRRYLRRSYNPDAGRRIPVMLKRGKHNPDLLIQFWYGYGERLPDAAKNLAPYDLVVCGGLITKVPDPTALVRATSELGARVLHTVHDARSLVAPTPPPDTVRMFSRLELEQMFSGRNRILESRTFGSDQRLVAMEYAPNENWGTPEHPSVVIYCGPGWEEWTPDQIDEKGLGGSETAVVLLARELVRKGMRVTVYAPAEGVWGGVVYRHWSKFNPAAGCWAFVSWRNPRIFDNEVAAVRKVLWIHDTDYRELLTEERAAKVDSVWAMSEWHRGHLLEVYPFLEDKVLVVGNGIDPSRFVGQESRKLTKTVYSSSPDRGLEQALTYWPKIREAVPEAELHVFYDWVNYDLMRGPADYKHKIVQMAAQDGVIWRGRVGQRELARELVTSAVLLYPGPHDFCETYGITFLEAQAAGCVPVTRDNGALPETNRYGIIRPNDSSEDEWVRAVQEALNYSESDRTKMREWALAQTWEAVADRIIAWAIAADKADLPVPVETAGN